MERTNTKGIIICLLVIAGFSAVAQSTGVYTLRLSKTYKVYGTKFEFMIQDQFLPSPTKLNLKEGIVLGRFETGKSERNIEIGKIETAKIENGVMNGIITLTQTDHEPQSGDLLIIPYDHQQKENLIHKLACLNIYLKTESEKYLYDGVKQDSDGTSQEAEVISNMVKETHYVAGEMRGQMESPQIEDGPYSGIDLFTAMEKANSSDVRNFLLYITTRPKKYMGTEWSFSEVFATWMIGGAPSGEENPTPFSFKSHGPETLHLDLSTGKLNGQPPTLSPEKVKTVFPFFTGETEEGTSYNCGGGVYFLNNDFYFYTHRDYIEARLGFSGTVTDNLLGKMKTDVTKLYGKPDLIPEYPKEEFSDLEELGLSTTPDIYHLYKRKYGTLVVVYDPESGICKEVQVHTAKPKKVLICW